MKQITCIGIGLGNPDTLTIAAKHAIESCDLLIGASRMLSSFSHVTCSTFASCHTNEICDYIVVPKVLPMNSNSRNKEKNTKSNISAESAVFLISVPNCKFLGTMQQSSVCTEEKLLGFQLCEPIQKLFY